MTAQRRSRRIVSGSNDRSGPLLSQTTRRQFLAPATQRLPDTAWCDCRDPLERIFALVGLCRRPLVDADGHRGGPLAGFVDLDAATAENLRACFTAWTDAIHRCLLEIGPRLPDSVDRLSLAEFVLATMEGASAQARAFGDVGYFDRAVRQLREHFDYLLYDRPALPEHVRRALPGH